MAGPRVVIIGAGVVGAALADELSARGWTEVTVVDQGPLPATGGSSSHAPGLVFQTNPSKTMTELARYTVEKFCSLDVDGKPCFLQVGGLEVATTAERLAELHRRHGWLTAWGIEARQLSAEECVEQHPLVNRDKVLGGLLVPTDGLAKAVLAVEAQIRRATERGVRFLARHEVLDVRQSEGRVSGVVTDQGELPADIVVCCAGIWGPKIARMVGHDLPLTPLAHQLAWTGPVPALAGQTEEAVRPILRHQDADLYYRDRFDGLGIGYYGHRPMPVAGRRHPLRRRGRGDAVGPEVHRGGLRGRLDRDAVPAARDEGGQGRGGHQRPVLLHHRRLPAARRVAGRQGLLGRRGRVGHPLRRRRPGRGRVAGRRLTARPSTCTSATSTASSRTSSSPEYVLARDCQNFVEVYDILHPLQPAGKPRPLRTSPFHARQRELGAFFLEANGWERPQWYEANARLLEGRTIPTPNDWAASYWSPIVGAEAQATRETVAMYDMTALKRLEVTGPGAAAFLRAADHRQRRQVGRLGDVHACCSTTTAASAATSPSPGWAATSSRSAPTATWTWTGSPATSRPTARSRSATSPPAPAASACGARSPARSSSPLTDEDFSNDGLKYFRAKRAHIGTVPVTAMRLSLRRRARLGAVHHRRPGPEAVGHPVAGGQATGRHRAGRGAFNSLRLEKGYRSFGTDMTYEHDPYEAGVGFAVEADKGDFLGKAALERRKADVRRKLTCLTIDDPQSVVMGKEPVYDGDRAVGYVTSAAYGYTIGKGIAYAWLPAELATPGTTLHIGYFDRRVDAVVAEEPLFDPTMSRLRG